MPAKSKGPIVSRNVRYWRLHYASDPAFREKCKAASRKAHYRRILDPAYRLARKDAALRRRYGISLEDFDGWWEAQEGLCPFCGTGLTRDRGKATSAQTDHDHASHAVRGLLCLSCNAALGKYERWGARLAEYLRAR